MQELKTLIKEAGLTQSDISLALNIKSLSTVNLKLNGKAEFSTKEATILKNMINEKLKSNYTLEDLFSSEE